MGEFVLHKINITTEAKFDYADIFNLFVVVDGESFLPSKLQLSELKKEVETYIQYNENYWHKHYFKVKYLEERTNKMILVFIRKSYKISNMQIWDIVGFCDERSWNEEMEEFGTVKSWLNTKVENLPKEKIDWAEELYRNKILEYLDLIYDIGGKNGYIRTCEGLAQELSTKYPANKVEQLEPRKLKRFIKREHWTSKSANEFIELLDRLLELEREASDRDDLFQL